jgi:predicted nucleic-acid-binding protein
MSSRRLLDTNLVVRHLVQGNEPNAAIAARQFAACDRGEITLVLLPTVLAECVFVLESFYEHDRGDIARVLTALLNSPGIEFSEGAVHVDALERYRRSKLHFVDCLLAATAAAEDIPVATLDREFRKFPDVQVELK